MEMPRAWTLDRSLPVDLFSWGADDVPPVYYSESLSPDPEGTLAERTIGCERERIAMDELVWTLDERFGATSREIREDGELVWHAKSFEVRVRERRDLIEIAGVRRYRPELQRLEKVFSESPLALLDPRLRAFGWLFHTTYSVWRHGARDWSMLFSLESHHRVALRDLLSVLGFSGTAEEKRLGDQMVLIHGDGWSFHVETNG